MDFVTILLNYQIQFKIYHWQTKSYARHVASDELVSAIQDIVDYYVETIIGSRIPFDMSNQTIQLANCSTNAQGDGLLNNFIEYLSMDGTNVISDIGIVGLENKWQEFLGQVDKIRYKFMLD